MTDDELALELRKHPATTARSFALSLGLTRVDAEAALRRLVADGRAQVVGTTTGLGSLAAGQTVYDPNPAWL